MSRSERELTLEVLGRALRCLIDDKTFRGCIGEFRAEANAFCVVLGAAAGLDGLGEAGDGAAGEDGGEVCFWGCLGEGEEGAGEEGGEEGKSAMHCEWRGLMVLESRGFSR